MAGLGDTLRGLGSALNPQVMQQVQQEDLLRQQQQQQTGQLMLAQLIKGVETGAIDPSKLPPQLQNIVGPTPQVKREMDLRKAFEALTPEQRQAPGVAENLFLRYADPKEALSYYAKKNDPSQLPQLVRLQAAERQYRASGQNDLADQVASQIKKLNASENSQTQEMIQYITDTKRRMAAGENLTQQEKDKAIMSYRYLTQPRMDQSGAVIQPSFGNEFDPSTGFGAQAAPVAGGVPGGPAPTVLPGGRGTVTPGQVKPGEAEIKVLSESDALKGHLQDLDKRYKPDWVGPLAGRAGALGAKYGNEQLGTAISPERSDFVAQSALYKNRLIKFITGAQMSEQETQRLINEIPDVNDPPRTFEAKRKISETNIDYVTKAYQQNMRQAGVRQIGGNPVSGNAPITATGPNGQKLILRNGQWQPM